MRDLSPAHVVLYVQVEYEREGSRLRPYVFTPDERDLFCNEFATFLEFLLVVRLEQRSGGKRYFGAATRGDANALVFGAAKSKIFVNPFCQQLPSLPKRPLPPDIEEIMERAIVGLQRIVRAIEDHPWTGPTGRSIRFLAGL